jgi:hypothetical protein
MRNTLSTHCGVIILDPDIYLLDSGTYNMFGATALGILPIKARLQC